ncbi:hypothetical protein DSO57_1019110 [Entomophthora muscae]|uniref:Uncharacterized protein n=1 Tax=Entomophthora muscae TaxID=34485 RepID=A0ACC2UDF9_9FUNG|nr:hypothetical protein DSO57_1019110 [Entomophthora muscae]
MATNQYHMTVQALLISSDQKRISGSYKEKQHKAVSNIPDTYGCVTNVQAPAVTKQTSAATVQAPTATTQKPTITKLLPTASVQTPSVTKKMSVAIEQMNRTTRQTPITLVSPTCKPFAN